MRRKIMIVLIGLLIMVPKSYGEDESIEMRFKEMERKIEILTREVEKSKIGKALAPVPQQGHHGFAPAASKVYQANKGVSIGGYGEMVYEDFSSTKDDGTPSGKKRQIDFLRAIVYVGYKFTDKILFNSEIEFEHATTSGKEGARGEVSLEFALLDFLISKPFGVRTGLLLVPMGFINEMHEPPTFHGVNRPSVERNIIPTTWRENGLFFQEEYKRVGILQSNPLAEFQIGWGYNRT